jgi:nucleotide-binding universal stress UspA family protein
VFKNILVGIDASEHARNTQAYAFYLARRFDATVTGLHVVDIVSIEGPFLHDISGSFGLEPYLDLSFKMREALTARGNALLETFANDARGENLRVETILDLGIVANVICERARSADLLSIGHRGINERFSTGLLGSTAESVTRKCARPVLISPMAFREPRRAVLAYDASERASNAMRHAAEFCGELKIPLTVVTVARDAKIGERSLKEARGYFRAHSGQVDYELLSGHVHEALVAYLKDSDADLLFIGAYGHSRIIEMVLGSTTEYVLRNVSCPVFLSR